MGGLIKFLGRFRSASNSVLALRASHLISVSKLAALHVIYMYRGTGTCTIFMHLHVFSCSYRRYGCMYLLHAIYGTRTSGTGTYHVYRTSLTGTMSRSSCFATFLYH